MPAALSSAKILNLAAKLHKRQVHSLHLHKGSNNFVFFFNHSVIIFQDICRMEVVEWSARLARKRAFRVRRLLAPLSLIHMLLL